MTYRTIREYYRYGNENDYVDCTDKEWDSLEKAIAYAHRYAKGIKFVSCRIEDENDNVIYELFANGEIVDNRQKFEEQEASTQKTKKKNTWFTDTFLASFEDCNGKRISEKQGAIFEKYLKEEDWKYKKSSINATYYTGTKNGRKIEVQKSQVYNGCYYNNTGRHTQYKNEYYLSIQTA